MIRIINDTKLSNMVIIIYDNFIISPSLASAEEVLALDKLAQ